LEQFAPVIAATGNNDGFSDPRSKPRQYLEIEGWRIGMAHDLAPETRALSEVHARRFDRQVEIMVGGHTHLERLRHGEGMILINSGSPVLPHHKDTRLGTVGLLELSPDSVLARIHVLGETEGRVNPGRAHELTLTREELARS
jgi:putative phosphoesterase